MYNFYLVSTPIGNIGDITARARDILNSIDFIVCESEKEYKKLFYLLGIKEKKFILCNEHNENEAIELVLPLLKIGEKGALISDCGTPVFEDPGYKFINSIRGHGYKVTSLPGASSLTTAISLSPFKIESFFYAGLLPKNNSEREISLRELLKRKEVIIFIEAPYRLKNILETIKKLNSQRDICIAYNLTMEDETIIWGNIKEIEKKIKLLNIKKGEYIIIINKIL
ncbi:MAG: 16S rRNA (cytidine(1402)-2'-O)-methyltransferase [Spirochaetes bacterium]|nr:16S rRNA (cytidine(1402)-2'-O)-methyltransferase [Spirochaetota bacterium]